MNKIIMKILFLSMSILLLFFIAYQVCSLRRNTEVETKTFTIEYALSGGLVGFMDKATIKSNGEFKYMVKDKVISEGTISEGDIIQIRKYAILDNNFTTKKSETKNEKVYPDMLFEDLTVIYDNKVGTSKKSEEIIKIINKYKEKLKK